MIPLLHDRPCRKRHNSRFTRLLLAATTIGLLWCGPALAAGDDTQEVFIRCATPDFDPSLAEILLSPTDCAYGSTNPLAVYDPGAAYVIPVVVHVIESTTGEGSAVTDERVQSQIDVLNEDFAAMAGTPGEPGTNVALRFELAGITRTVNDTWFNDGGTYWTSLSWDTNRYLNIYVNSPGGSVLGYVPGLPQQGTAGAANDRVVIYWRAFGRPSELFAYSRGRTTTHEVGHYFGLWHTFSGGCVTATAPACYTNGDRICDTNPEGTATSGCPPGRTTCSVPAPYHNYMDYSNDNCMNNFTLEQSRRIRCTIQYYRPNLFTTVATGVEATPARRAGEIAGLELRRASPNPLTAGTSLRYLVPSEGVVSLSIYDEQGRRVRTLLDGMVTAGDHGVTWNGADADGRPAVPGVYFARLAFGGDSRTTKLIVTR